jgi:glycosyltransferase 2 family protein
MTEPEAAGAGQAPRRSAGDILRVLLVAVAAGLGIAAVGRDVDGFLASIERIGLAGVVLAAVLTFAGLLISGEVWRLSVAAVAARLPAGEARRVFFVSQLGKYLPGALWPVVAQVDSARRAGHSGSRMAVGALLFLALHLLTGLGVAVALVPWAEPEIFSRYPWLLALLPVLAVALVPPVLTRIVSWTLRLIRRPGLPAPLGWRDVVAPSLWLLLTWAFYGAAAVTVVLPVADESGLRVMAAAAGGFALAWVVGVLVVPAPAGIGAREVAFVIVLSGLIGVTGATSVAIVLRVIHTLCDLLLAWLGRLFDPSRRRRR